MRSWTPPAIPRVPGHPVMPHVLDTASAKLVPVGAPDDAPAPPRATLYVCGITPYDATHLGHAATYLAFDTLVRLWLDAGLEVVYAQNVTDIDDPLLERARETGVDWRELADAQTELFRGDMESLRIVPPTHFAAVTEHIDEISAAVSHLVEAGLGYRVEDDIYLDHRGVESDVWRLGDDSHLDRATMLALSAERGGDPDRPGKRDALDPLLWRAQRPDEPSWPSPVGPGRPGWHVECSVIADLWLGTPITVQGGGSDLVFPHHDFTTGHTAALTGLQLARANLHTGMVAFAGQKMSKSLGNLVLVSDLVGAGTDPRAIRLALLAHHFASDWEWTPATLTRGEARLARWLEWAADAAGATGAPAHEALADDLRAILADNLDTPRALDAVERHIAVTAASADALDAIDALLGIDLREPGAQPAAPVTTNS